MSVTSACSSLVSAIVPYFSNFLVDIPYQREDTSRGGLVLNTLGEEQQTLARLAGPSSNGVSNSSLLTLEVVRERLDLDGLLAEVEVALDKTKAPVCDPLASCFLLLVELDRRNSLHETGTLVAQEAISCGGDLLLCLLLGGLLLRSLCSFSSGGSLSGLRRSLLGSFRRWGFRRGSLSRSLSGGHGRGGFLNRLLSVRHGDYGIINISGPKLNNR